MGIDLVTGGAGFIGSNVVARLVAADRDVRVVDDLSTGDEARLAPHRHRIELIRADLVTADLAPILEGVERVFHLAAVPSVPRSVEDPLHSHHTSATATLRVLLAAREAQVRRFVHSSSSSIYGDTPALPKGEDMPLAPVSPYGIAKAAAEGYVRAFARLYGLYTVALRYFNVFGPTQDPTSGYAAVIPLFISRALDGRPLPIFGDGHQTRDFTFVDNVVGANLTAAAADVPPGRAYNIAGGQPHSVLDLVAALERVLGRRLAVEHRPPRAGDIVHSYADVSAAKAELGWSATIDFEEGLRRTVEWYRTHTSGALAGAARQRA